MLSLLKQDSDDHMQKFEFVLALILAEYYKGLMHFLRLDEF